MTHLEPHIDSRTMEIHHSKHHQGYTNKLNAAIEGTNQESKNIRQILTDLDMNNMALRNNAGGYFNHKLFWEIMNPNNKTEMSNDLSSAIDNSFGSFDNFLRFLFKCCSHKIWFWLGMAMCKRRKIRNMFHI